MPLNFDIDKVQKAIAHYQGPNEPNAIPRVAVAAGKTWNKIGTDWFHFADLTYIDSDTHWKHLKTGIDEAVKAFLKMYDELSV